MDTTMILTLFDYHYWATRRILDAAERLSQEQFTAPAGLNFGSLRATLAHTLGVEMVWRLRCQEGISPPGLPPESDFATLPAMAAAWAESERSLRAYVAGLSDEDLDQTIRYRNTKGMPGENLLWQLLLHVVNHGTQHRAEAALALTHFDCSPGDVDLTVFLREKK